MTNTSNKKERKCALCGKTIRDQQEQESILNEEIDGTFYFFDTKECVNMFKRFRSVYGSDFKDFVGQHQFVSDPFWNKAIPTEQEITEIDKEIDKPDSIRVLRDPVEIQKLGIEIGKTAIDEILILYSTANAFHRQEKLGAIQSLREVVEGRGVKTRILTPKSKLIEESVRMLKQQPRIDVRYIEPGLQTHVSILIVDRKASIVVELKDDTKNSSYDAMGLGIYTNRKASVLSYVSMFESLWKQTELYEQVGRLYEQQKFMTNCRRSLLI